jgi:hypothetical protein
MKPKLSLNTRVLLILGLISIALPALVYVSDRRSTCADFLQHDKAYFAKVAEECDRFLAEHRSGRTTSEFQTGDMGDDFLQPLIREIGPTTIRILTDSRGVTNTSYRLILMVGVRGGKLSKDGYEVIWANSQEDLRLWELSVHTDGLPDLNVFELTK